MPVRLRAGVADILLCAIVVALQAEFWVTGATHSTMELIAFTAGCAVLLAAMLVARATARRAGRARVRLAAADDAARAAAAKAATDAMAEAVRARHAAVADAINTAVVEIVAVQQAVVRAAHPDDILIRVRSAEDNAYASLEVLHRIAGELATLVATAGSPQEPDVESPADLAIAP